MWSQATVLLVCLLVSHTVCENTYTLYISKYIRPGFEISFTFTLLNGSNPVQLTSVLQSADQVFSESDVSTIEVGSTINIVIGTIPLGYTGSNSFVLNIIGVDSVTDVQLFANTTDDFVFASKALSIYIQTDKAIYQPGQEIQFRALCLKPDLRPFLGNVTYQVMDPKDNIVLLETDVALTHGVAGGKFALHKDSFIGDWKIVFSVEGYKESLPVTVKLYKLPKFEVIIDAPSVIHAQSPGITIKISAKYTYGKPVDGSAALKITSSSYHHSHYFPIYGYRQPEIVNHNNEFEGSWELFLSMDEIRTQLSWDGQGETTIYISGNVTEALTSTTFTSTTSVSGKTTNIKVEKLYSLSTIKPGLSYSAYIRVSEQDGSLLSETDRQSNQLILDIIYRFPRGHTFPEEATTRSPWSSPTKKETLVFIIPPNGLVELKLDARSDEFESVDFEPYTNTTANTKYANRWTASRAKSPSNSFLQITTRANNVVPGSTVQVAVRTTETIPKFRILVLSRGKVLIEHSYTTAEGSADLEHTYTFDVTHAMMPSIHVLASYVREDGEIVADFTEITVSVALENQVSISSSSTNVDAGDDVDVTVQTSSAGAYVGLRAIDKSVLLLKSGNDITQDRVSQDLDRYSVSDDYDFGSRSLWWWWYPRPSGAKDATDVFNKAGMLVLTDALLYNYVDRNDYIRYRGDYFIADLQLQDDDYPAVAVGRNPEESNPDKPKPHVYYDNVIAFAGMPESDIRYKQDTVAASPANPTVTPRSYFPETWLWTSNATGADGSVTFNTRAPDTITSWVLSAFSISDQHGLGIADTSQITVFRNFFVSLNFPLKIIRGEIVVVQANVFNYFKDPLEIEVTLSESDSYELIIPGEDAGAAGMSRQLEVPADGAVSVYFPLRMTSLGEVPVTVTALSEKANDAVTRRLFVRPEGIQECYSASLLISRESANETVTSEELQIKIPDGIITGSEKVNLYVYGEILGSTLNNLGRLLRAPSGCGEQNMIGFAPDVFVTLYLHTAGLLDQATRDKAYKHFQDGYSNELRYKHTDGSYSAFGDRDASGSTWLTAFVTKCFMFARKLRPQLVETRIIDQALNFLILQQNANGTMREPGRVSHKDMQGGVNSAFTMTAYVLITLTETDYASDNQTIMDAANAARGYLEEHLPTVRTDPYALSLVAYALQVSGSLMAEDALQALEELATISGAEKYWSAPTADASTYDESWRPPYYRPPTNEIEMTAYALMTYARRGDVSSTIPVIKWLTSKQNEFGGYSSTQDTVIAIQALSAVAALLFQRDQSLSISLSHSEDERFQQTFDIDKSNSMVFNSVRVPALNGMVNVESSGVGIGVVQLSVCYNVPTDPFDDEPFECDLDVKKSDLDSTLVDFCCSLKTNDNATGMFLFELGLPSGFDVDVDEERRRNRDAQLVELQGGSFNVYYNELLPAIHRCANIELRRIADVAAVKPPTFIALEYYRPRRRVKRMLSMDAAADAGVCEVCGDKCVGCPGNGSGSTFTASLTLLIPSLAALLTLF